MYRGLIKSNRAVMQEQDTVIIDANAMVAKKLEELTNSYVKKNAEQTAEKPLSDPDAERLAALLDDPAADTADGFSEGITGSNIIKAEPAYQGPSPEELVEQAKQEIAQIKQDAAKEIEQAKQAAIEEGRKAGYDDGFRKGMQETEQLKKEYEVKAAAFDAEYEQKIKELEPP